MVVSTIVVHSIQFAASSVSQSLPPSRLAAGSACHVDAEEARAERLPAVKASCDGVSSGVATITTVTSTAAFTTAACTTAAFSTAACRTAACTPAAYTTAAAIRAEPSRSEPRAPAGRPNRADGREPRASWHVQLARER